MNWRDPVSEHTSVEVRLQGANGEDQLGAFDFVFDCGMTDGPHINLI